MTGVTTEAPSRPNVRFRQVGRPLTRTDAPGKVAGRTPYAGDYVMPDMLHLRVVRADVASARLVRLDVSRARALQGVACVLTAADLPDRAVSTDIPGQVGRKRLDTGQQILVRERVRYFGEPLALIAAETRDVADHALELVEAELEPIPGVYDPAEAMQPGAPIVTEPDNIVAERRIRKGDVEAGFAEADVIVENTFRTPFQEHAFLEPEVGLAWVDENDVVNIRVSTQVIEHFRPIADAIGVPHNKVRIRGALVGGGFGGKEDLTVEIYLALLARRTGRPVRLEYTREDSFVGHGKRHPFVLTYRTGVTRDGRITALDVRMVADSGAYVFLSPYVLLYALVAAPGPYRVDNLDVFARAVATNNMFTSAFRGFGALQACAAYEQQMDEVAKAIGLDRMELRRRNFLKTGEPMSTGFVPPSAIWTDRCAERAWAALGEPTPARGPIRIGRGIGCYQQSYGRLTFLHDTSEAWVGVEMDGTVVVRSGVTDIGAGQVSALGQIAVEALGTTLDNVVVYNSDSAVTPLAGTTTATRALYMTGNAVKQAAEAVRARLVERGREGVRRRAGRRGHGFQRSLRGRPPGPVHAPGRAGPDLRGGGYPPLRARHVPRAVHRLPRSGDRPGPGPSRLRLRRACGRGGGGRRYRRGRSPEERRRPRRRAVHQSGRGGGPDPGRRPERPGLRAQRGDALRGGAADHAVVQRVPDAHGHGHAQGRMHHPRIAQRRRPLRRQGHRRAGDDPGGPGDRQRRRRRHRSAGVRDADHAGAHRQGVEAARRDRPARFTGMTGAFTMIGGSGSRPRFRGMRAGMAFSGPMPTPANRHRRRLLPGWWRRDGIRPATAIPEASGADSPIDREKTA